MPVPLRPVCALCRHDITPVCSCAVLVALALQVMFDKAPTGIWNLRPDSLALLLSLANVAAHSRCLLLENCQGLLAAACAERMGGLGVLCCVGTGGKTPGMSGLRQLNLSQQERSIVCCTQLSDLQAASQVRCIHSFRACGI